MVSATTRGRRKIDGKGPFIYDNFRDNHVIWPGRESHLRKFFQQSFKGMSHKMKNAYSANSEDARASILLETLAENAAR
jgi:hypothetical protein